MERAARMPRWILAAGIAALLGWLLYTLQGVLVPVFFAFLIAYALDPVVDFFEKRRVPRTFAILIVLGGALLAIGLFLLLVLPGLVREVIAVVTELPAFAQRTLDQWEPKLNELGVQVPHTVEQALAQLQLDTSSLAERAAAPAATLFKWVLGGTASLISIVSNAVLIPVFAFYLLYDFDHIVASAGELVPLRWRPFVSDVAREIDDMLSQWIRGQLTVMAALAVLYSVAFSLLGVRLAVPIGIAAGLLSFIPYVGGATAIVGALVMCFVQWTGWGKVGGVVAAYALIQVIESFVLTPRVVGEKVGLSAIWVLLALMVFGELFGFLGVLLAVPTAAVLKIFVVRMVEWYRESPLFTEGGPPPPVVHAPAGTPPIAAVLAQEGLPDAPPVREAKEKASLPPDVQATPEPRVEAPVPEAPVPAEETKPEEPTAAGEAVPEEKPA